MTRDEYLAWCKQRALEYVDAGNLGNAVASMISDIGQWQGGEMYTPNAISLLGMAGILACTKQSEIEVRRWIEGFR